MEYSEDGSTWTDEEWKEFVKDTRDAKRSSDAMDQIHLLTIRDSAQHMIRKYSVADPTLAAFYEPQDQGDG